MYVEAPRKLSPTVDIDCYCCETSKAAYRCRFKVGELQVQVCLCSNCLNYDTTYLFENTIGLSYPDSVAEFG